MKIYFLNVYVLCICYYYKQREMLPLQSLSDSIHFSLKSELLKWFQMIQFILFVCCSQRRKETLFLHLGSSGQECLSWSSTEGLSSLFVFLQPLNDAGFTLLGSLNHLHGQEPFHIQHFNQYLEISSPSLKDRLSPLC